MNVFSLQISDAFGERWYTTVAEDMDTAIKYVRCAVADAAGDPIESVHCIEAKRIDGEVVLPLFPEKIDPRDPSSNDDQ